MSDIEMAGPSVDNIVAEMSPDDEKPESEKSSRRQKAKPTPPSDFEDEHDFLRYMRTTYDKDREADDSNRREMVLDARFLSGDQWDAAIKQRRDSASKPTLTVNRLPAYVAQLIGNRRMNDVGIKVIPDMGGTKKIADIREGLIRSIQKISRAQLAYDKAFEQQVIGGLGNFQINLDYAHDDVFEQDIRIASISNPLAVVWDQGSVDPSGADAQHVFVTDRMSRRDFKRKYPDTQTADWETSDETARSFGWDTSDSVQVVSFWRMRAKMRTLVMLKDGSVEDVTDISEEIWFDHVAPGSDGMPMIRDVSRKYAQMYLCTAQDILQGPYDLPIDRVPVLRVPGWEMFIEGDRIRWGLIRFLRDPQKLHNYWRSTIAEKLTGSPKAKWVASVEAVEGHEDEWRKSHLSDDPLLVYNGDSGAPPTRVSANEIEAALIQQADVAAQDIRDVSNIHEASMGQTSNEVSGRAIAARQRVGELGTVIYQDNLNIAIEEAGRVINQLIPFVYDTPRLLKVLGADMLTEQQVPVNGFGDSPESVDITLGKYSVTVTTGPSYTTRRVEAREEMMSMVNSMPDTMAVAADKIVEAQDWPGADEIARRLRSQLPPGMVAPSELSEDEQKAAQQQQQAAQQQQAQQQQLQQVLLQLQIEEGKAKIAVEQARAQEAQARARESVARAGLAEAQTQKALADIGTDRITAAAAMVTARSNADRQDNASDQQ